MELVQKTLFTTLDRATAQGSPRMLEASWQQLLRLYIENNPTVSKVVNYYATKWPDAELYHDHFAFRTFGVPQLGIESMTPILAEFGYTQQNYLTFPAKKLLATWFAPPKHLYDTLPRVFVSELQVEKLSPQSQEIIQKYVTSLPTHFTSQQVMAALLTGSLPWTAPERADYEALLQESEYAAWTLVNGYRLNHTTVSVHRIAGFSGDIAAFADLLKAGGFTLNGEGGVIKVSPDKALLQCSTVADTAPHVFADGSTRNVAHAYMEFAERLPQPEFAHLPVSALREEQRRDGFEVGNADKIFHSTTLASSAAT